MYAKIENSDGLVRDMSSGAVLNTNRSEYEKYIMLRDKRIKEKEHHSKQAEEINNIKNEIREIKEMLLALTNK
jgi:hypothetical protein